MKRMMYGLLALVAIIVMACSSNTPGGAALKYYNDVKNGNYEAYVEGIAFKEEITAEDKEQFVTLMKEKADKEYKKKEGISKVEMLSEEMAEDGQTATVTMKITYGNGETEESDVAMVLKDGVWKMDMKK